MNCQDYIIRDNNKLIEFASEMESKNESRTYLNKVYIHLLWMQPGHNINIAESVKAENIERFIKCVCLFIYERPDYNIQFSNEYDKVIRK